MPKKAAFYFLGVVAIGAAILVPHLFSKRQEETARAAAPAGGQTPAAGSGALKVFVHRVTPRTLAEKITAPGTLLANESVELRSEISGKIVAVHFAEGARVKKGDLLIKINDSELAAQLRRTLFRIELAKAQEARQKQLVERGGTSQESFDTAVNEVRVLEAEADLIRAQLDKTEIRAPFGGMIGLRQVSEGSYITPTTNIATLQDVDRLKIDFTISERYMNQVHTGSPVVFTVAGRPEKFHGSVYAVEPAVDVETRTVVLRALGDNPDARLLPGAYASVEVTLDEMVNALLVPTTAIIPGLNQRTLFVVENGKAAPRTVETGIRLDREIQIVHGLEPDAVVITSGLLQLRPGLPVEAIPAP